jgi:hypothetical protein
MRIDNPKLKFSSENLQYQVCKVKQQIPSCEGKTRFDEGQAALGIPPKKRHHRGGGDLLRQQQIPSCEGKTGFGEGKTDSDEGQTGLGSPPNVITAAAVIC